MTEGEELKQKALLSEAQVKVDALEKYLDELVLEIDKAKRFKKWSFRVYVSVWLMWVATSFFGHELYNLFTTFFIFALIYDQVCSTRVFSARSEFRGAIRVLEILGYITPRDRDGERKREPFWSEGVNIVKGWVAKKKKLQDKVFSPA